MYRRVDRSVTFCPYQCGTHDQLQNLSSYFIYRNFSTNRTVSCVNVLLELLTVLLEYIDLSVIAILISRNSYYYTNILPIMLALCSMLSGTYYAHNYASIIGGSLIVIPCKLHPTIVKVAKCHNHVLSPIG